MKCNPWVGGSIGRRGFPMLGTGKRGLSTYIKELFANGEQGFFYDPSVMWTMYQDASGTTTVNAEGQPVGLILDKSRGLTVGEELFNQTVDFSKWVKTAAVTSATGNTFTTNGFGGCLLNPISNQMNIRKGYLVRVVGRSTVQCFLRSSSSAEGRILINEGEFDIVIKSSVSFADRTMYFQLQNSGTLTVDSISVKELAGNHAYQSTSAARPIFRQKPILGSDLLENGSFSAGLTGWTNPDSGGGVTSASGGTVKLNANGGVARLRQSINITSAGAYLVEVDVVAVTGGTTQFGIGNTASGDVTYGFFSIGEKKKYSLIIENVAVGLLGIAIITIPTTAYVEIENISVKELKGYHTDQNYIEYDKVDDKLITNLPAPLTNATVLRAIPNVGTQVKYNQTLPRLYEDSTNHSGLIAIDRALTRKEQLRLMEELDKRAGATSLETLTFKTFDNNQEGFVYDPNDLSTMFQDALGTNPVTKAGQSVGLVLDKSKGLRLGTNLMTYPNSQALPASIGMIDGAHTWTLNTQNPISGTQDSRLVVTEVSTLATRPAVAFILDTPLVVGKVYKFSFKYKVNSGTPRISSIHKGDVQATIPSNKGTLTGSGTFEVYLNWAADGQVKPYVYFSNESVFDIQMNEFSIQEVLGNHAYQTTSASRPILRQNATTGANYLEFDGVDDYLATSTVSMSLIDKVTVITGMRHVNSAYQGLIHFANNNSADGAFYLSVDVSRQLRWQPKGTVAAAAVLGGSSSAPSVFTAKADISGKSLSLAVNQNKTSISADMGTGSFGKYQLYLGARQDIIHKLTGDMYGLVIVGKLASDTETAAIEKELAKRTGVTLNV